jgi:hypothetical protein
MIINKNLLIINWIIFDLIEKLFMTFKNVNIHNCYKNII